MHELYETPVRAFGTWDAPMTDDAEWIDVPTELQCFYCTRHFMLGDNGAIMPTGLAQHRECSLRGVMGGIGHLVDHGRYCHGPLGPDAGLPFRVSAVFVWQTMVEGRRVTEAELEVARAVEARS